jgi:endonuclease-3
MRSARHKLERRLQLTLALLEQHQGVKSWPGPSDPLDSLMLTLLSQNTNDNLRDKAYARLRRCYPRWEQVLRAPVNKIEEAIRIAGLSKQKAARMKKILAWVKDEFGTLSLANLNLLSDDGALELLQSQTGIGVKTAAVVLMFALGRDLCPVDTHVHRIAGRLGWVAPTISAEKTFEALRPHVPKGKGYSLHMNLLQFGRTICQARKPLCGECFLYDECVWEGKKVRRAEMREAD